MCMISRLFLKPNILSVERYAVFNTILIDFFIWPKVIVMIYDFINSTVYALALWNSCSSEIFLNRQICIY